MEEERAVSSAAEEEAIEDDEGEDELDDDDDEGAASKEYVTGSVRVCSVLIAASYTVPSPCSQEQLKLISRVGGNRVTREPSRHLDPCPAWLTD